MKYLYALAEKIVQDGARGFHQVNPQSPFYEVHSPLGRVILDPSDPDFPCMLYYTDNKAFEGHGIIGVPSDQAASLMMLRLYKSTAKGLAQPVSQKDWKPRLT